MLKEILETRFMVKREMKLSQQDKSSSSSVLKRVLEARQLAIKLLANVTYGYTAASFSGRMPMSELADAIVQSGRSTLEWTKKVYI
jgi:DNA polymerase zeta